MPETTIHRTFLLLSAQSGARRDSRAGTTADYWYQGPTMPTIAMAMITAANAVTLTMRRWAVRRTAKQTAAGTRIPAMAMVMSIVV